MSVLFDGNVARLHGDCPVADAETLATGLQAYPDCKIDLSAAGHLHTAVVQILLAFDAEISGNPTDAFLTGVLSKEGRMFFFEKKNQKTFSPFGVAP
jgi:hypothetical protein